MESIPHVRQPPGSYLEPGSLERCRNRRVFGPDLGGEVFASELKDTAKWFGGYNWSHKGIIRGLQVDHITHMQPPSIPDKSLLRGIEGCTLWVIWAL